MNVVTAQVMAILSQLAIVLGMVLIGLRHFDNIRAGIAAATLYLLLPYTAMWTGSVTHALPAALLVWAVLLYRRPLFAGAMIGLAFGTIYYPMFLVAALDQLLLAEGRRAVPVGLCGDGRRAGRHAGVHVERHADVPGLPQADVRRPVPDRREPPRRVAVLERRSIATRSSPPSSA